LLLARCGKNAAGRFVACISVGIWLFALRTSFRKDFASESEEQGFRVTPRVAPQTGFSASFLNKLLAGKMMLHGHLRKKEPALRMKSNEQTMAPDFDGFGSNRRRWREQRDFDAEIHELIDTHGRKARIFYGCAGGAANNGFSERLVSFDNPDASLEPATHVQRHENALALREDAVFWDLVRKFAVGDSFRDGQACQL
jgi:hypothetical protein